METSEKWDTSILRAHSAPGDPITALFGSRAKDMRFDTPEGKEFLEVIYKMWDQAGEEASKECFVPGCNGKP